MTVGCALVATRKMQRIRGWILPARLRQKSQYEKMTGYQSRDLLTITRSGILSWRDIVKITLSILVCGLDGNSWRYAGLRV